MGGVLCCPTTTDKTNPMKTKVILIGVVLSLFGTQLSAAPSPISEKEANDIALKAYLYAYPLIVCDVTRQQLTNYAEPPGIPGAGPPNRFIHLKEFPDPKFKIVIRPNVDTLYSNAWLDLAAEPMVLSVPATDRYFMLPMLSLWTDVFAVPGTRTTGRNTARNFAVVGPTFSGEVPAELEVIKSPTRYVWIIGRTQTNGKADYENVYKIQEGYKLVPLSAWGKTNYVPLPGKVDPGVDMKRPPPVQVAKMDAATFFRRLAALMKDNPPYFYDDPTIEQIERLGIHPGKDFVLSEQPETVQTALNQAMRDGQAKLAAEIKKANSVDVKGWNYYPPVGGFYGNDYLSRAVVAAWGLGMNLQQDAIYPTLGADSEGHSLNGANNYTLRFEKGKTPPVKAFWSITVYDQDGYLVPNSIGRQALGDRDKLVTAADGSITLYLQSESPGKDKEANWLPVPKGPFNLMLRMYWPSEAILDRTWTPPLAVKRVK